MCDLQSFKAHALNETAARVWIECDGQRTVQEIARRVSDALGQPVTEDVVQLALQQLDRAGLMDAVPVAAASAAVTRRTALASLGRGAAAAVLLPVVTTLVLPTPAMAHSAAQDDCPGGGDGKDSDSDSDFDSDGDSDGASDSEHEFGSKCDDDKASDSDGDSDIDVGSDGGSDGGSDSKSDGGSDDTSSHSSPTIPDWMKRFFGM